MKLQSPMLGSCWFTSPTGKSKDTRYAILCHMIPGLNSAEVVDLALMKRRSVGRHPREAARQPAPSPSAALSSYIGAQFSSVLLTGNCREKGLSRKPSRH